MLYDPQRLNQEKSFKDKSMSLVKEIFTSPFYISSDWLKAKTMNEDEQLQ